ncbi:helix-turn-helix domain-containing protein [Streptomyces sp. NPDC093064]|uniref:helix-turn-helix domain-containing protein n=1 Tax=unclassified Streptomyces TaxID=2593676 RepID=UPI00369D9805
MSPCAYFTASASISADSGRIWSAGTQQPKTQRKHTVQGVAEELGVARTTIYRYLERERQ